MAGEQSILLRDTGVILEQGPQTPIAGGEPVPKVAFPGLPAYLRAEDRDGLPPSITVENDRELSLIGETIGGAALAPTAEARTSLLAAAEERIRLMEVRAAIARRALEDVRTRSAGA